MHKCWSYGPDKLNLWPFHNLTFKCDLDLKPTSTNVSNSTSTPQGKKLSQIFLKSLHKCTSYGLDKLNLRYFIIWPSSVTLTFNLPEQMFQMALLLLMENSCAKQANSVNLYPPPKGFWSVYSLSFRNFCSLLLSYTANLLILNQFNGNKSCTINTTLTKFNEHSHIMTIQNQVSWNSIHWLPGYDSTCWVFKQFKANNSLRPGEILTKSKMHECVIVIHI